MSNGDKINKLRNVLLTGALMLATSSVSEASAQNNSVQDKKQNTPENVVSKRQKGISYANLVNKLWNMYRLVYTDGEFLNPFGKNDIDKCQKLFETNPKIKEICQNADEAIGGPIRGPRTLNAAERYYPNLRSDLDKEMSSKVIKQIDAVGEKKLNLDDENVGDMVWRMYTYVTTHGGTDKKNPSADFFKKYPEFYEGCQDAAKAMKDITTPLERTSYSDIMYFNLKSDNPFNTSESKWKISKYRDIKDFDTLIDNITYVIVENRDINERQIRRDAEDVQVPDAAPQNNNAKGKGNTYVLGY
ncbi:MAG: hypothetical protein IKR92_04540 [Alphaproteobacteria bacterium]|nr:hypothetical protein [Alphaproteobacteria bacterium]